MYMYTNQSKGRQMEAVKTDAKKKPNCPEANMYMYIHYEAKVEIKELTIPH